MLQKSSIQANKDLSNIARSGHTWTAFTLMLVFCFSFVDNVAASQKAQSVISITKSASASITTQQTYVVFKDPVAQGAPNLNLCYHANSRGALLSVEPLAGEMGDHQELRLTGSATGSTVSFSATRDAALPASNVCELSSMGYISVSIDPDEYKSAPIDTYLGKLILMVKPE